MPLDALPISSAARNERAFRALHEWLLGWFDGEAHDVGRHEDVEFPALTAARIRFNQGEIAGNASVPIEGADLQIALLNGRHRKYQVASAPTGGSVSGQQRHDEVVLQFNLRVRAGTLPESNLLADRIADALHLLLITPPAHADLQHCGLRHLSSRGHVALNDEKFARRQLLCSARLTYDLPYERD